MAKKIEAVGILCVAAALVACMDRPLAPICPVPIEVKSNEVKVGGYLGVDMIVVVDNSGSMDEEQAILSEGLFTLIGALTEDAARKVDDVRVAIVSSDMGLQYGGKAPDPEVYEGRKGWSAKGDDGEFKLKPECIENEARTYLETNPDQPNAKLAEQFACAAKLGDQGCGIEQQLEAAVRGVERGKKEFDFVRDRYLLAVIVVSDEEDCSIAHSGLFGTPEWKGEKINLACNLPVGNEEKYLYPTSRYRKALAALKGSEERPDYDAVVFAAIVGVPNDDGGCQGPGDALEGCVERPEMELHPYVKEDYPLPIFKEACVRVDDAGNEVTAASPGRRYVKVAQDFGDNGYVYSICNADWSPAMEKIAKLIRDKTQGSCFDRALEWDPATQTAKCDVFLKYRHESAGMPCPEELGADEGRVIRETVQDGNDFSYELVSCPLPKLPAPLGCSEAVAAVGDKPSTLGWYYCKNDEENDEKSCNDGSDNDGDNLVDDKDPDCSACTPQAIASGSSCRTGSCQYKVELTAGAQKAAMPSVGVEVRCLSEFSFEDENCQENTNYSCMDGKDNDGNGVWDCQDVPGVHEADPNCCPIVKDSSGVCRLAGAAVLEICEVEPKTKEDLPGACLRAMDALDCRGELLID